MTHGNVTFYDMGFQKVVEAMLVTFAHLDKFQTDANPVTLIR
jgi:hypothetical protein